MCDHKSIGRFDAVLQKVATGGVVLAALVQGLLPTLAFSAPEQVRVMVTLPPQRYFVERVGGPEVMVDVMVPPGSDPHTYEPRPAQMVALKRSRAYFAIGDAFEAAWLARITSGAEVPLVVRTDAGIVKIGESPLDGPRDRDQGRIATSTNTFDAGADPHIWLVPALVKIQAEHIRDGLSQVNPSGRAGYAERYARFAAELDLMDAEFQKLFSNIPTREFVAFHPAWAYFAQAYGLKQDSVERDGKNPTPAQMQQLIVHMRKRGIRVIFAQPQRSLRTADSRSYPRARLKRPFAP